MRSRLQRPRALAWLAAGILAVPATSPAQTIVRGQVLDEADLSPIAGAVVSLIDEDGDRVRSVFVDDAGGFILRLPDDARYTVRAEMIGRQSVEFLLLDPHPPSATVTLRLPADPIELEAIDVSVGKRCSMAPSTAEATYLVWQEVQKALRAASLTATEALYRFRVAVYRRVRDGRDEEILEEEVEEQVITGYDPFSSLPPEEIHEHGYVGDRDGERAIYGPSTAVLLSRSFEGDHCFGLRRDPERRLIGLTFEPAGGRRVPEIEGVLWLDEASAELRTLEFTFVRLPRFFGRGDYRGLATFRRLDAGSWTIDRWWLRTPPLGRRFVEEAGEILEVVRLP